MASSSVRFPTRFVVSVFFIVQLCFSAVGECRVDRRPQPRPRKNVEFMGEGAGDGCVLCEELVLCCPQFTITLDSSAFTGPLPPLTIPTGTRTLPTSRFISCSCNFVLWALGRGGLMLMLVIDINTGPEILDTVITSSATIPRITIPTCMSLPRHRAWGANFSGLHKYKDLPHKCGGCRRNHVRGY